MFTENWLNDPSEIPAVKNTSELETWAKEQGFKHKFEINRIGLRVIFYAFGCSKLSARRYPYKG